MAILYFFQNRLMMYFKIQGQELQLLLFDLDVEGYPKSRIVY
jgi:hypothetical protein